MDEEQHYEKFSTENDFVDGVYIGEEFFGKRKQGRQQTADDRLYGIFAGDSSDEEGGRKRGKRNKAESADYSKPVAFKSSGVTVGSSLEKPEEVDRSEAAAGPRAGLGGLGFGGGVGGLGFQPAIGSEKEEAEYEDAELPTQFGQRILQNAKERQREQAEKERRKAERRGTNKFAGPSDPNSPFEKHTKGIGSKLLAAMGYKAGQGLGKNQQGISTAIEAKLRPKGMGMGYRDYEEHKLIPDKPPAKEEKAQVKQKVVEPRLWKKGRAAERVRREYRTADEILAEAAENSGAAPRQTILDMRGPQAKLVTNMENLNAAVETVGADATPMPELQHNLRLLVDLAEADIQRIDGKLRHEKDTAVILGREAERLAGEAVTAKRQVDRLGLVLQQVKQCQSADASTSLGDLHIVYQDLHASFPEEYIMHNLAAVALVQVLPRMKALMAGWAPLSEPQRGLREAHAWRLLLESAAQRDAIFAEVAADSSDPYTALLSAAVIPHLASAVTNLWEPRDPEPMLAWIEAWQGALPAGLQITILDTLVFPKLSTAVEAWQPQAESIPLHAWLHPWLPYLGPRLESLYPTIRFKLSTALQQWHPSDGSALALLSPWHTVFEAKDWEALMLRSILPKLAWALSEGLVINPAQQDLTVWHWVLAWAPVLPPHLLVNLLETHFFPRWHDVLRAWLTHSPNYDEISSWYLGWKGILPAEVQDNERVREQLNNALMLVNSAMEGAALPSYAPPPSADAYATAAASSGSNGPTASRWGGGLSVPTPAEPTLRQLIEQYAQESHVEFLPKAGRRHEGLQVYGFGLVSIVMDNTAKSIRAQMGDGRWVPTTLEDLVKEHVARAAQRPGR